MKIIPFRKKQFVLLTSLLTLATAAYAAPFSVTVAPGTTLPTTLVPGITTYAFYTVTNLTSSARAGNFVKYFPLNVTQVLGAGLCGSTFTLGANGSGTDSCVLQLAINGPVNDNDSNPTHHLFVCATGGLACAGPNPNDELNVTGTTSQLVVTAGAQFSNIANSQLLVSTDGAQTFRSVTTTEDGSPLPTAGTNVGLSSVSCLGSGGSARCFAVPGGFSFANPLLIAETLDGGATWNNYTPPGTPNGYDAPTISCSGGITDGICVEAKMTIGGGSPSVILKSSDGGSTFSSQDLISAGVTNGAGFYGVNCFGNNVNGLCILSGFNNLNANAPMLVVSLDSGNSWFVPTVTGTAFIQGGYFSASCNQVGGTCIASGSTSGSGPSPIAKSTDGGATWQSVSLPTPGAYSANSCFGSPAVCVILGQQNLGQAMFIYRSTDNANTWASVPINAPSGPINRFAISCFGPRNAGTCMAAGLSNSGGPILVGSFDSGATWNEIPVPNLTFASFAAYTTISCRGNGGFDGVCVAAGFDGANRAIVVRSIDGGHNWVQITGSAVADAGPINSSALAASVSSLQANVISHYDTSSYGFQKVLDKLMLRPHKA